MRLTLAHLRSHRLTLGMLLVCIALTACGSYLLLSYQQRNAQVKHAAMLTGTVAVERLQRHLIEALAATYPPASAVRLFGDIPDFPALARELMRHYPGIHSLQLAPLGIVEEIYPLEGNERAIGHDLLADPNRKIDALRSIDSRELTLAGPVDLLQGGRAVIGRLPIFTSQADGSTRFWGFSIALIGFEDLLERAELTSLRVDHGYNYALSRIDPVSRQRHTVARSMNSALQDPVRIDIQVPGGQWELAVVPHQGWQTRRITPTGLLLVLLVMVPTLLFAGHQVTHPARLSRRIERKTAQLAAANTRLLEEADLRQRAVEALQVSEARWRQLVTYAGDGLLVHDGKGAFSEVNAQAAQLLGMPRERLLATTTMPEMANGALATLTAMLHKSMVSGDIVHGELARTDGGRVPVELATARLGDGEPARYLTLLRDISDRITIERALNAAHDGLEQRVALRSSELRDISHQLKQEIAARRAAERRLRRSKQTADESLEAKNRFMANVSHEIRTPINGLLGMLSLLDEEPIDVHARLQVRSALDAGGRLLALLNNLLHLARFEAREQNVVYESVDPHLFCTQLLEQAKRAHPGLDLHLDVDPALPAAVALDVELTGQVLEQALGWIADHAAHSQVAIEVRHGQCRCMPRLLFEIHGDRSPHEHGGSEHAESLQLAVSRELVNLLDGNIHWYPDEMGGFHCRLSLPLTPDGMTEEHLDPGERQQLAGLRVTAFVPCQECTEGWHALRRAGSIVDTRAGYAAIDYWLASASADSADAHVVCAEIDPSLLLRLRERSAASGADGPLRIELGGNGDGVAIGLAPPIHHAELASTLLTLHQRRDRPMSTEVTPRRVLVVDDDAVNRKVVSSLLRNLGHRADEAGDGPAALEMLRHEPYDYVLLDIRMPGMDGPATARRIRQAQTAEGPRPVVLAMTALDAGAEFGEAIEAGMDGVLEKPLTADRLRVELARWKV